MERSILRKGVEGVKGAREGLGKGLARLAGPYARDRQTENFVSPRPRADETEGQYSGREAAAEWAQSSGHDARLLSRSRGLRGNRV